MPHHKTQKAKKVNAAPQDAEGYKSKCRTTRRRRLLRLVVRHLLLKCYKHLKCGSRGGIGGPDPLPPPGKAQVIWVSIEISI